MDLTKLYDGIYTELYTLGIAQMVCLSRLPLGWQQDSVESVYTAQNSSCWCSSGGLLIISLPTVTVPWIKAALK